MSILFIGLTVGSVVVISSGTTYYVTKRRNYHDSDLPKGSSFYSATNRNFSLFGSPPSHFYNVIHSNIIPVKNRVKFLLQCSAIGDIRIYYRQDMKLIFKITPQPYLFNSVKVNLLNESYKAIMMDFSEDPKFVEMKVNDQKFQVQIIGTPHLLLVISYSFDFKERSDDFDFATQLLSDEIEKLRDQKGDLTKKITKVIENYYNLNLAYGISTEHSKATLIQAREILRKDILGQGLNNIKIEKEIMDDLQAFDLEQLKRLQKHYDEYQNSEDDDLQ